MLIVTVECRKLMSHQRSKEVFTELQPGLINKQVIAFPSQNWTYSRAKQTEKSTIVSDPSRFAVWTLLKGASDRRALIQLEAGFQPRIRRRSVPAPSAGTAPGVGYIRESCVVQPRRSYNVRVT